MTERNIFLALIDLPQGERAAHLDRTCGGKPELRAKVEALLIAHEKSGNFLNAPCDPDQTLDTPDTNRNFDVDSQSDLTFLPPGKKPGSLGRLAHYEILEVLGRGGFGIVFKAFDEKLHRVVAIKAMAPHLAATSPPRKRFLREARAVAAIKHENVVAVFAVEEQPVPYLVMEFVSGETLQQHIDRTGPLDLLEIQRFAKQIALGLQAAHDNGLIHRDIKPGNILIESGPEPKAKLTDFGLARAADDASLTHSGMICGTPMYMAPEQAEGKPVSPRSDLFSLGSVMYVMCSGRPPFRAESTLAVLRRVTENTPRPIQEIVEGVPDWLCSIIEKLHEKCPEDRYASAGKVVEALDRTDIQSSTATQKYLKTRKAQSRSRLWLLILGAFTMVACVIGLAALAWQFGFRRVAEQSPKGTELVPATVPKPAIPVKRPPAFVNSIGMEFVKVPKGTGWLGGSGGKPGETKVVIEEDFYLGKFEVTQEQWQEVMGQNPSHFLRAGAGNDTVKDIPDVDLKGFPVESVSWDDCQLFLKRLNERQKDTGWVYRLPKEAEWEYACRGGPVEKSESGYDFYFSKPTNSLKPEQANSGTFTRRTCKVGSYEPNSLGLYDLHGNVHEWSDDGEGVSGRVARGGNWMVGYGSCLTAYRDVASTSYRTAGLGLRVARVPVQMANDKADRKPAHINGGDWRIDGDEMIQAKPGVAVIEFGDTAWTDYDYAFETKTEPGVEKGQGPIVYFRAKNAVDHMSFVMGAYGGEWFEVHRIFDSQWKRDIAPIQTPYETGRWDSVLVRIRGTHVTCSLNGKVMFNYTDEAIPNGRIGLATWNTSIRYRNLKVTSPEGKILFEGFPDLPSLEKAKPAADPDRTAANYVIGIGGQLRLHDDDRVIKTPADLPPDPLSVRLVQLRGNKAVTNSGLAACTGCTHIEHIDLVDTPVSDAGMKAFKDCKNLMIIDLARTTVGDEGLGYVDGCKSLASLWLSETRATDKGMASFKDCRSLIHLAVDGTSVGDDGLIHFKGSKTIHLLLLHGTRVTDVGVSYFKDCSELEALTLNNTPVGNAALKTVAGFTKLKKVDLKGTNVTAEGVAKLRAELPNCNIEWDEPKK
ncbi:hypothetical protein BH11PLA2_BH11PLA2_31280 [soil metagenome]